MKVLETVMCESGERHKVVPFFKGRLGQYHDGPPSHSEVVCRSLVLLESDGETFE